MNPRFTIFVYGCVFLFYASINMVGCSPLSFSSLCCNSVAVLIKLEIHLNNISWARPTFRCSVSRNTFEGTEPWLESWLKGVMPSNLCDRKNQNWSRDVMPASRCSSASDLVIISRV